MNLEHITIATLAVQRYAEMHPRPPHVTQAQAARMLDMSAQTMCKMVRNGIFKLNKFGMIPITQIDDALVARY